MYRSGRIASSAEAPQLTVHQSLKSGLSKLLIAVEQAHIVRSLRTAASLTEHGVFRTVSNTISQIQQS